MSRVKGKFFTNDFELKRMNRDIRQEQEGHGTTVDWWFYLGAISDETYDEGGRRWRGPVPMPVVSVVVDQGPNVPSDSGRFVTDAVTLRMGYRQITGRGIGPDISSDFEAHYGDRFVFRDHVYSVESIHIDGHFDPLARDVMVQVEGGQLRPDELVNDVDFTEYAA
jgi:hypothetical protein